MSQPARIIIRGLIEFNCRVFAGCMTAVAMLVFLYAIFISDPPPSFPTNIELLSELNSTCLNITYSNTIEHDIQKLGYVNMYVLLDVFIYQIVMLLILIISTMFISYIIYSIVMYKEGSNISDKDRLSISDANIEMITMSMCVCMSVLLIITSSVMIGIINVAYRNFWDYVYLCEEMQDCFDYCSSLYKIQVAPTFFWVFLLLIGLIFLVGGVSYYLNGLYHKKSVSRS